MPIYLATFSLQAISHDYSPLWAALESVGATCLMDATWLIDVSQNALFVTNALLGHCVKGDRLFVLEFVASAAWTGTCLDAKTKAWLVGRMSVVKTDGKALIARGTRTRARPKPAVNA